MAISYNNITYDKVLTPLRDKIRAEFKGALPTYFDSAFKDIGTKSLRIFPNSQTLQDKRTRSYINLYDIEMTYYLRTNRKDEKALDQMYKDVTRIVTVLINNRTGGDIPYFYAGQPTIEHDVDETDLSNILVAKINVPVLYEEVHEKFIRFATSNNNFFVTSTGSFYIVRN
tara:strand:- start:3907 stop:4419 length:513 start_codon:yes stop_codon:yes gene_type:complete